MNEKYAEALTILHISDIHRTSDEPVTNQSILNALIADLRRQQENEGLPKPDILVVSGDLTQAADEHEYDDAQFCRHRFKDIGLARTNSPTDGSPGNRTSTASF